MTVLSLMETAASLSGSLSGHRTRIGDRDGDAGYPCQKHYLEVYRNQLKGARGRGTLENQKPAASTLWDLTGEASFPSCIL